MLFVGRLIAEKGIFDLVEALPRVLERTSCELVVVGEGEAETAVRARVRHLALDGHVTMTGYLSRSDVFERYREATIFVLPSWNEGFATVLAEAMDAGLPIVTTCIRGAADYLVAGENALFISPGDRDGLAAAITTLLMDPNLRKRMGKANRERLGIFEPDVVAHEYVGALQAIAKATREARRDRTA